MRHDPAKLREDILRAVTEMEAFCRNKTFRDSRNDRGL